MSLRIFTNTVVKLWNLGKNSEIKFTYGKSRLEEGTVLKAKSLQV